MSLTYTVMKFRSQTSGNVNREGLPAVDPISDFKNMQYLDAICEQAGGTQLKRTREKASPTMKGTWMDRASSLYKVGNAMIRNKTEHFERQETTVVVPEGVEPDTDIVSRLKKYYCEDPETETKDAIVLVDGVHIVD